MPSCRIGYKKLRDGRIARLQITGVHNEGRVGVKRRHTRTAKYRCSEAKVLDIYTISENGTIQHVNKGLSLYDERFRYTVGEIVTPQQPFNIDLNNVMSSGIHYFLSEECAQMYNIRAVQGYTGIYKDWYDNGELAVKSNYVNGLLCGERVHYNRTGVPYESITYANDKIHGIRKTWYDNGRLREIMTYVNGELHGMHKKYFNNGKLHSTIKYVNDTQCEYTEYFSGKPLPTVKYSERKRGGVKRT